MAAIQTLLFTILLILPLSTLSQITNSPSPAPGPSAADSSPPPATISSPPANAPSPDSAESPPAPPPSDLAPTPGEDDGLSPPVPPPIPSVVVDLDTGDDDASSNGMTAGRKAGVAVGVIAGVAVVGIGAIVFKKRQQNIRRTQYGEAARRDFL